MDGPTIFLSAATAVTLVAAGAAFFFLGRREPQRFALSAGLVAILGVAVSLLWLPQTTPIPGVRFAFAAFSVLGWLVVAAYLEIRRSAETLDQSTAVLAELAGTDELTGLVTRQSLRANCSDAMRQGAEKGTRVSLIVADVDRFRAVNDALGSEVGDSVLRAVASILGNKTRAGDCAARLGSDEFALMLPDTPAVVALQTAEAIRSEVARTQLEALPKGTSVTVSVGVASLPADMLDPETLLIGADAALMEAKRKGRNQVCTSPDPVSEPARDRPALEPA